MKRTEDVGVMVKDGFVVCRVKCLCRTGVVDGLLAPRLRSCVKDVDGEGVGRIGV